MDMVVIPIMTNLRHIYLEVVNMEGVPIIMTNLRHIYLEVVNMEVVPIIMTNLRHIYLEEVDMEVIIVVMGQLYPGVELITVIMVAKVTMTPTPWIFNLICQKSLKKVFTKNS